MKKNKRAIFLFHRDLRLDDNRGLAAALESSETVIPVFVLDPRQVEPHPYRSRHALAFLRASLLELDAELRTHGARLTVLRGQSDTILADAMRRMGIDALFANRDYTPFSRARDTAISALCAHMGIPFQIHSDALLHEPEELATGSGSPFRVFKAFMNAARKRPDAPVRRRAQGCLTAPDQDVGDIRLLDRLDCAASAGLFRQGGRKEALAILGGLAKVAGYVRDKDFPAIRGTTGLSAHLKFGTISIRETRDAIRRRLGPGHELERQLLWRDFFTHVAAHRPSVFGAPFRPEFERIPWRNNAQEFAAWCEGRTGFPIVDAGMRELALSGFMHNRVRMIVASFLVKDLLIDWRWGEKYFATRLIDYDPCVNNGNWQWSASTGCDAQPYFRIFNPWRQQERFDPEAEYIRKWVPELRGLSPSEIHALRLRRAPGGLSYPAPIVADHGAAATHTKEIYRKAAGSTRTAHG